MVRTALEPLPHEVPRQKELVGSLVVIQLL